MADFNNEQRQFASSVGTALTGESQEERMKRLAAAEEERKRLAQEKADQEQGIDRQAQPEGNPEDEGILAKMRRLFSSMFSGPSLGQSTTDSLKRMQDRQRNNK